MNERRGAEQNPVEDRPFSLRNGEDSAERETMICSSPWIPGTTGEGSSSTTENQSNENPTNVASSEIEAPKSNVDTQNADASLTWSSEKNTGRPMVETQQIERPYLPEERPRTVPKSSSVSYRNSNWHRIITVSRVTNRTGHENNQNILETPHNLSPSRRHSQ